MVPPPPRPPPRSANSASAARFRASASDPTAMITAKLNHWMAYERWGPLDSSGIGQRLSAAAGGGTVGLSDGTCCTRNGSSGYGSEARSVAGATSPPDPGARIPRPPTAPPAPPRDPPPSTRHASGDGAPAPPPP